jgi:hypothetical protein
MAKKKHHSRKKKVVVSSPKHNLPNGFWSQVGAIFLIVISILLVVSWFNTGGPVLEWLYKVSLQVIGYSLYIIPALFVYVAVEIFRSEDNRLPLAMKFATGSAIIWLSSLFGLLKNGAGQTTGGFIGDLVNKGMLQLVDSNIAAFIYILLIVITLLFITRVSPFAVITSKLCVMPHRLIALN